MPTRPDLEEVRALVRTEAQQRQAIEAAVAAGIVAEVRSFTGWYDRNAITRFAGLLAKLASAGQRQTASSTSAYASRILTLLLGKRPSGPGVIQVGDLRGGVPLESVYGRLADEYRFLVATRGPDSPAVEGERRPKLTELQVLDRVVERAEIQTGDNLSLAMRDQWAAEIEAAPATIAGFRRVIHPELIAEGSTAPGPVCALCVLASDRVYSRADLLPLHARCRCSVSPLLGDEGSDGDPGLRLNRDDFKRIYGEAGSTAAVDLKRVKVRVTDHGELGPRLSFDGHHVRDADEVARDDEVPSEASAS